MKFLKNEEGKLQNLYVILFKNPFSQILGTHNTLHTKTYNILH